LSRKQSLHCSIDIHRFINHSCLGIRTDTSRIIQIAAGVSKNRKKISSVLLRKRFKCLLLKSHYIVTTAAHKRAIDKTRQKEGLIMQSNEHTVVITTIELKATQAADATRDTGRVRIGGGAIHYADVTPARDATKDTGRVRIGGGAIHYSDATPARDATKDAGRVRIGGGAIHYADATPARDVTKDTGRVRIGGGAICF
jgi:hypothetical protein